MECTFTVALEMDNPCGSSTTPLMLPKTIERSLRPTDLVMPGMTGIELCEKIRDRSEVPIIVLSVCGEEKSKVEALDKGADDYVTKPFGMNELVARVRANLRRSWGRREPEDNEPIDVGDVHTDLQTRIVSIQGKDIHLTTKEFDLMVYMARQGPHPRDTTERRMGKTECPDG